MGVEHCTTLENTSNIYYKFAYLFDNFLAVGILMSYSNNISILWQIFWGMGVKGEEEQKIQINNSKLYMASGGPAPGTG